jgi:hypothetical protein
MRNFILCLFCILPFIGSAQEEDYTWWNEIHGWEPGMPGWRNWMHITPGYLGPNALPVPEMKEGVIPDKSIIEIGTSAHFMNGDPTQDIFGKYFRSFCDSKIAIELYGVLIEHYAMTVEIRDERVARDYDGKGYSFGDFYFSTLIQMVKDRKFPDTMIRFGCKTASGNQLEGARHSDSPGYFIDMSFSKTYSQSDNNKHIRPFGSLGFYSWQTNDELNLQNDAYMYGLGINLKSFKWSLSNSLSGYSGYKNERDQPLVYTFDLNRSFKRNALRLQYLYGIRDWKYHTVRLSYHFTLNSKS